MWIRGYGRSDWHDHHALQIALALDGGWSEFQGAIVRSHRHHQFEAQGVTMAQLFIEPATVEWPLLRERYVDDISPLPDAQRFAMVQLRADALRTDARTEEMIAAARAATLLLAGAGAPLLEGDARFDKAIAYIPAHIHARSHSTKALLQQPCRQDDSDISSWRRRARAFMPMYFGRD